MKRIVFGALVTAALAASGIVAHASLLSVDAGVLQAITHEIAPGDIVIPDSDTVTVSVTVIRFNSGNGNELGGRDGGRDTVDQDIPLGSSYTIVWDGGPVVPCNSVNLTNPPAGIEGNPGTTYTALADASQYFCVQTGGGTLSITVGSVAGAASAATGMPVETTEVPEYETPALSSDAPSPSTSLSLATGGRCLKDGWRGRIGPDGAPYESEQECVEGEETAYQERLGESSGDGE